MPIAMSTAEPDMTVAATQAQAAQRHPIASTPG